MSVALTNRAGYGGGGFGSYVAIKTETFTGGAEHGLAGTVALFTVTGAVLVRLVCVCTESLIEAAGGGTIEVGIASATTNLIAATTSADILIDEIWNDATPNSDIEDISVMASRVIAGGADIFATVRVKAITDGTLVFALFWTPITPGATVVAA